MLNTNSELHMLHSPYRVDVKDYDEGHGGPVPSDYIVRNNVERVVLTSNLTEAERVRDVCNQLRISMLERLLAEAKQL